MRKIRVGNDIWVRFAVLRDTELEGLPPVDEITVTVENISRWDESLQPHSMTAIDGVVSFLIKGIDTLDDEQANKYLGKYRVAISYRLADPSPAIKESLHTVDAVAFELVQFSSLQGEEQRACPEVAVETVELSGNIAMGRDGKSAYELAVQSGFVGTEQEWLDSLNGDKGDAGTSAYQAALDGGLPEDVTEVEFNQILAMNSEIIGDALDDINGEGYNDNVVKKIARLNNTKQGIAEAIIGKGVTVTLEDTFTSYADKVKKIDGAVEAFYRQYGFGYAVDREVLLTMAKQSYEETKDWTDYSKARGNVKIRFIPQLDITNPSLAFVFADCTELLSASIMIPSKANISSAFTRCNRLLSVSITGHPAPDLTSLFHACHALVDVTIDTSGATILYSLFAGCTNLATLPLLDFTSATNLNYALYGCISLTTLGGFKDVSVSFSLAQSTKLTVESLLNVLNHLADMTGTSAPVLTLGAVNLAKLTIEQKAIATNKNWTLN